MRSAALHRLARVRGGLSLTADCSTGSGYLDDLSAAQTDDALARDRPAPARRVAGKYGLAGGTSESEGRSFPGVASMFVEYVVARRLEPGVARGASDLLPPLVAGRF
jgi:hypothetical protein